MGDRFLLHYSQKDPRDWRLRCLIEHPYDPGWEQGTYEKCHEDIRPKHKAGDTIIDVVVRDQKPVIRSMFTIKDTAIVNGEYVWYFDEYYFADKEPYPLTGSYIKYRMMFLDTYLNKYSSENPVEYVKKHYIRYKKGEKPASIKSKDWDMILERRKEKNREKTR